MLITVGNFNSISFQFRFQRLQATQAPDGRWHQLLNDTNSFLETSVTAMFLTSIVRGVRGGVLDRDEYALTFPNTHRKITLWVMF